MHDCLSVEQFKKHDSGQLGKIELGRVREHLATCSECNSAYEQWRSSIPADAPSTTQGIPGRAIDNSSPSEKFAQSLPNIEGYRITGVLGQGGMGVVYRAVQTKLNRVVALKLLPTIVASPQAVSRFRREAKAAARLHHTNIVPIYDFGESREGYFYAMELIEGQPLNNLIRKFADQNITTATQSRVATVLHKSVSGVPIPSVDDSKATISPSPVGSIDSSSSTGKGRAYYQQVARWMADAADALHYAHNEGIIHRDIKPGNMILSGDARIMITDFGLAKCSDDESVTIPGVFMGAIRYVSPEQAMAGRVRVDHRTDIYSLGATMYELLALQPAFPGSDEKEILAAIIARDPTPLRKLVPTLPPELETICQKTLEKLPDARYDTARALAEDLRRFLNDLPIVAKRPGLFNRSVKYAKRHRALVTGVVAGMALSIASGIAYLANRGRVAAEVEALVADGDKDLAAQNWDSAGAAYQSAIQLDRNFVPALGNLAIVRKEQFNALAPGDPELLDEAITLADRALKLDPTKTRIWNTKGVVLKIQEKLNEAAVAYGEATRLSPEDPYTWANLAAINVLRGQLDEASGNLETAARFATPKEPMSCGVLRDLAVVQFLQGQHVAAESIQLALACNPSDEKSLLVRARMLLTAAPMKNAEMARDAAASGDVLAGHGNAYLKRYLALAHLRLGRHQEAIEHANAAMALDESSPYNKPYSRLIVAIAEHHLGRPEAASLALKDAEAHWPDELRTPGSHQPSAVKGFLWFESADELLELRKEIESLLDPSRQLTPNSD